jgi:DeoR/GlpR family transcriptional regulator of sugar metabolism
MICDESKIGKKAFYSFADLESIDTLIANSMSRYLLEIKEIQHQTRILT